MRLLFTRIPTRSAWPNWIQMLIAASIGIGVAFLFSHPAIHAQDAIPEADSLTIQSVNAYSGTINSGDMLVVIEYRIDYAVLPSLTATDAYICRFWVDNLEVNNSEIVSFNNLGYGLGACSMYFTDAERIASGIEFNNPNAEDYDIVVQGKPSAFADPPLVQTANINYRSASQTGPLLLADTTSLAERLENDADWIANDLDLITFTTGQEVLTSSGEAYLGRAVPNLQIMIPDLFGSSTTAPEIFERNFGNSEETALINQWRNSAMDPFISGISNDLQIGYVFILGLIGLAAVLGSVWLGKTLTGSGEFGLLAIPFTFPLVTVAGLGSMTALFFTAAVGLIGLMYSLFLRRAG